MGKKRPLTKRKILAIFAQNIEPGKNKKITLNQEKYNKRCNPVSGRNNIKKKQNENN